MQEAGKGDLPGLRKAETETEEKEASAGGSGAEMGAASGTWKAQAGIPDLRPLQVKVKEQMNEYA